MSRTVRLQTHFMLESQRLVQTHFILENSPLNTSLLSKISLLMISPHDCEISLASSHPFFEEHRVFKQKVLPGVAHIELAMLVLKQLGIKAPLLVVESFCWLRPVMTVKADIVKLLASIKPVYDGYQIEFKNKDGMVFSSGKLSDQSTLALPHTWLDEVKQILMTKKTKRYSSSQIYDGFSALGIDYGSYFRCIDYVDVCDNTAQATLSLKPQGSIVSLLDCALQSGMAISLGSNQHDLMPFTLGAMVIKNKLNIETLSKAKVFAQKLSPFRTHTVICDNDENPLLYFIDLGISSKIKQHQDKLSNHDDSAT